MSAGCPSPTATQTGILRCLCVRVCRSTQTDFCASLPLCQSQCWSCCIYIEQCISLCVCEFGDSFYLACSHDNSRLEVMRCVLLQRQRDPVSLTYEVLAHPAQCVFVCVFYLVYLQFNSALCSIMEEQTSWVVSLALAMPYTYQYIHRSTAFTGSPCLCNAMSSHKMLHASQHGVGSMPTVLQATQQACGTHASTNFFSN